MQSVTKAIVSYFLSDGPPYRLQTYADGLAYAVATELLITRLRPVILFAIFGFLCSAYLACRVAFAWIILPVWQQMDVPQRRQQQPSSMQKND